MPNANILVSVIVPVYNVEQYLSQCLDSLIHQTLPEMELIIVNDGSPDHSQQIIDRYQKKHPDRVVALQKENGGLSSARNFGLRHARGAYVAFVDSDDFVDETIYQKLYDTAREADADLATCGFFHYNDSGSKEVKIYCKDSFGGSVRDNPELLFAQKPYAWNKLFRREWLRSHDFAFPEGQFFEDSAVLYNMAFLANKIVFVDEPLYYYRVDNVGAITKACDDRIFDIFRSMDSMISFYKATDCYDAVHDVVENLCLIHLFTRYNTLKVQNHRRLAFRYVDAVFAYLAEHFPNWRQNRYHQNANRRSMKKTKFQFYRRMQHNKLLVKFYFLIPAEWKKLFRDARGKFRRWLRGPATPPIYLSDEQLEQLQQIEREILSVVDAFCKQHEIPYYLGEGSLLGAVRHQGFIPWDDDMDILMKRADYNRFIELFGKEEREQCVLCNDVTLGAYHLTFSKVVTTKQTGFVNEKDLLLGRYNGPYLDIFPLDRGIPYDDSQRERAKTLRKYRDLLLFKCNYMRVFTWKRFCRKMLSYFYSYERLHKNIKALSTSRNDDPTAPCMVNYASSYWLNKQTVPYECYGEPVWVPFDGELRPIPQDPDTILTTIYGDYMTPPPENRRHNKHAMRYIPPEGTETV